MKTSKSLRHPMERTEAILGWVYLFVHMFALVFLLRFLNARVLPKLGLSMNADTMNTVYYAVGFVYLLIFLFHFWKESFADLCGNLMETLFAVVVGYLAYIAVGYLVNLLLSLFLKDLIDPNTASVQTAARLNPNTWFAISVFLAPIVEETLFRGVIFGTIRRSSRLAAYAVSAALFAFYHLWQYMMSRGADPSYWLYLLRYLPAGIVLAWSYERGKNVWSPIFLHMVINCVSITVTLNT